MASQEGSALGKRKERETEPKAEPDEQAAAAANNRLLAGYLAHEFLTHGTLFGQRFDPASTGSGPVSDPNRAGPVYGEVACLLKAEDGAHVPGVINPTQLGQWLRITD